jgi:hypothetical protein
MHSFKGPSVFHHSSVCPASCASTVTELAPSIQQSSPAIPECSCRPKIVHAYKDHALHRSLVEKAFATMIFSRIVEDVCSKVGVWFTGQSLTYKMQTMNGPDISLEDIIKFFGEKTPPGFPGSVTSLATFKNHRMCYMRIQSCVRVQEICCTSLNVDECAFLELLEKLLDTEYSQLGTLQASQYGCLKDFQERVNALNNKLYPKLGQQHGGEA